MLLMKSILHPRREARNHRQALPVNPASSIHPGWRFGHNLNVISATSTNCRSGDRLDWAMLAIWVFA